jgi:membrane protease YdiL (CAAX protease family)
MGGISGWGSVLSQFAKILFVLLLVAVVPILSHATARASRIRLVPRLSLYFSAVISQWLLAGLGLLVAFWTSRDLLPSMFRPVSPRVMLLWTSALAAGALGGLALGVVFERRGWWPAESELVYLLIPKTRREKLWCVWILAPTAAFCEEFLYRGYLLGLLSQWFHSLPWSWGVSSVAFGLAHVYQGWAGTLRAAVLGALLAYPVVRLGSLYPSILAHGLIDAIALAWLGPRLLRSNRVVGVPQ